MAKAEISWKRIDEFGMKVQVYAHHVGNQWLFYSRGKRFEEWQPVENPPLEDWLELLDAIKRRIPRRLVRPEEVISIRKSIHEHFPDFTEE
jgi:hypothetical protein